MGARRSRCSWDGAEDRHDVPRAVRQRGGLRPRPAARRDPQAKDHGDVGRARARQAAAELTARLHGAVDRLDAAADGGTRLDEAAFAPYADFLAGAGLDGVLAFGTNGEAVLLSVEERRRGLELWLGLSVAILVAAHCGAQTTADTVASPLTRRRPGGRGRGDRPAVFQARRCGAGAHLVAAAAACAPLPFYVYEFAATAGYALDPSMLARLREEAENVTGMKVSDSPWDAFERYLLDDFDIFVGPEALIHRGREAGAVGAVSALASAFPEEVAAVVLFDRGRGGPARGAPVADRVPRHAALKRVVGWKGVRSGRTCEARSVISMRARWRPWRGGSRRRSGCARVSVASRANGALRGVSSVPPTTGTSSGSCAATGCVSACSPARLDECVVVIRRLAAQGLHANDPAR